MDIVILGGGIAGLAAARQLQQLGWSPAVYERDVTRVRHGHGFILLDEGLASLTAFGVRDAVAAKGHVLERFELRTDDGRTQLDGPFPGGMGFRRAPFVEALEASVPAERLHLGKRVAHIVHDATTRRVQRVDFDDGTSVCADLFIDAVGRSSAVRSALHPDAAFAPIRVRELVSQVHDAELARSLGSRFLKLQHARGGLAVGMVPSGADHVVWYLQFDAARFPFEGTTAAHREAFARALVGGWAEPVTALLRGTDFSRSHVWNTQDLDPLSSLHGANVALIGDAAHPFLPFTSQGVNAALADVQVLGACLARELGAGCGSLDAGSLERALTAYSASRLPVVARIAASGRALHERFLHPERFDEGAVIPLSV